MSDTQHCPQCGAELPKESPEGLCPKCLMKAGLENPTNDPVAPDVLAETVVTTKDEDEAHVKVRYLGDYELCGEIARGGMGVVYRARQVSVNRPVALKMILAGRFADSKAIRRFHTEAVSAANLDHPNIVPIYEVGEYDGQPYFSMKLVEGGGLHQSLPRFVDNHRAAAEVIATVARAVEYAHQRGILHRDLKPANILLDAEGRPHISDFGLARNLEQSDSITQTGVIIGTPAYMSPEQAQGSKDLTTATDIYSLGAILYTLLSGKPVFQGDTALNTLQKVTTTNPTRLRIHNNKINRDLETICMKCLAREPLKRYGSALDLAQDLERWLQGEPIRARRMSYPERTWRWFRRKPAVSWMTVTILFLLLLGIWFATSIAQRARMMEERARAMAYQAHQQEVRAKQAAERQKRLTEQALKEAADAMKNKKGGKNKKE